MVTVFRHCLLGVLAFTSLFGCQTILDLEEAKLDPSLTTKPEDTEPEKPDESTSAPVLVDAGSSSGAVSSKPAPQCEGFDNSRVGILRKDGTLPPLPNAPTP